MAQPAPSPRFREFDANGDPLSGGKLYSYEAGTLTPLATYTDYGEGTANSNPVILDADGYADVWLAADSYKLELRDSADVSLWTVDNIDATLGVQAVSDALANVIIYSSGPISDRPTSSATYGQANHGRVYFALDERKAYRDNGTTWVDVTTTLFPPESDKTRGIHAGIDGGGATVGTGKKCRIYMPFACTITGWTLIADAVSSSVVDVKVCAYASFPTTASICGANPPTITAVQNNQLLAAAFTAAPFTTVALAKGDVVEFDVTSNSAAKRLDLTLYVTIAGGV